MPVAIGRILDARCEVAGHLGTGQVYRARDRKLCWDVALKVLPRTPSRSLARNLLSGSRK